MAKILIVGAGLFGQIAADLATRAGHEVTTIDASLPNRASPAAGCVLKPSWLASIPKPRIETGLQVLEELYGLESITLVSTLGLPVPVKRVDPDRILRAPDIAETVTGVGDGYVRLESGARLQGTVLVAAGVWSQKFIPSMPDIKSLTGASARFKGQLKENRIDVYAPYRQAVAYNINPKQVWFGDGSAILAHNWNSDRLEASRERAEETFGLKKGVWTVGQRPYVEGHKAGYFRKLAKRLYVSTGGAKNGVLLAAAQAAEFVEALK